MALIACPECKKKISDTAGSCPNCGYKITPEKVTEIKKQEQQAQKGCTIGCLSIIVIFFALFLFGVFSSPSTSSSDSTRRRKSSTSSSREVVENSGWDGSVLQVKSWLKSNLKDPGSLEFVEWSAVQKTSDGGFMVRVKYRAKNSFGGYVVENKIFYLNSNGSIKSEIDY